MSTGDRSINHFSAWAMQKLLSKATGSSRQLVCRRTPLEPLPNPYLGQDLSLLHIFNYTCVGSTNNLQHERRKNHTVEWTTLPLPDT